MAFWIAVSVWIYMTAWFGISLVAKRNDVADVAWGLGFVLLAWESYILGGGGVVGLLVSLCVTVWGVRLAWHVFGRVRRTKEDHRYATWRMQWGKWFVLRSYMQVYMLQGALMLVVVLPVVLVNLSGKELLTTWSIVGLCIWLFGFVYEAVADWQLRTFLINRTVPNTILSSGLWKYSRHPNYFGEITQWWGLWIVALASGVAWWSVLGPLILTFLIVKVSGVPMLEKKMMNNPAYITYAQHTRAIVPLPK